MGGKTLKQLASEDATKFAVHKHPGVCVLQCESTIDVYSELDAKATLDVLESYQQSVRDLFKSLNIEIDKESISIITTLQDRVIRFLFAYLEQATMCDMYLTRSNGNNTLYLTDRQSEVLAIVDIFEVVSSCPTLRCVVRTPPVTSDDYYSTLIDVMCPKCDEELHNVPSWEKSKCPSCGYLCLPCEGCMGSAHDNCNWTESNGCSRFPKHESHTHTFGG